MPGVAGTNSEWSGPEGERRGVRGGGTAARPRGRLARGSQGGSGDVARESGRGRGMGVRAVSLRRQAGGLLGVAGVALLAVACGMGIGATSDKGTGVTFDGGPPDAGPPDAGPPDAGPPDAGPHDAGPPDGGPDGGPGSADGS